LLHEVWRSAAPGAHVSGSYPRSCRSGRPPLSRPRQARPFARRPARRFRPHQRRRPRDKTPSAGLRPLSVRHPRARAPASFERARAPIPLRPRPRYTNPVPRTIGRSSRRSPSAPHRMRPLAHRCTRPRPWRPSRLWFCCRLHATASHGELGRRPADTREACS
jgi:hypothetical protein